MNRKWICCELQEEYVKGAIGRFSSTNKLISNNDKNGRFKPYAIYPPNSLNIDESKIPLVSDGGKKRRKSIKK